MCCRANVTVLYILAYLYNNELLGKKKTNDYLLKSENTHIILVTGRFLNVITTKCLAVKSKLSNLCI